MPITKVFHETRTNPDDLDCHLYIPISKLFPDRLDPEDDPELATERKVTLFLEKNAAESGIPHHEDVVIFNVCCRSPPILVELVSFCFCHVLTPS